MFAVLSCFICEMYTRECSIGRESGLGLQMLFIGGMAKRRGYP